MSTRTVNMISLECWCGTPFSCPSSLYEEHLKFHSVKIYCPHGHSVLYGGTSELDKARKELERERGRNARLTSEKDQVEASLRATKGQVTKLKKRVAAGVCPCCKRTFANLARHMGSQHPEYTQGT